MGVSFSNAPPTDDRSFGLTLIRTPADRPLVAVITSDDLVGCNTHYWGGRTVPCQRPVCKPCADGIPFRWHGYVGVFSPTTGKHALLELTAQACDPIAQYVLAHGTTRGAKIECSRHGRKQNGRVWTAISEAKSIPANLPDAPNIPAILAVIWNMPRAAMEPATRLEGDPEIIVNGETVDRLQTYPGIVTNATAEEKAIADAAFLRDQENMARKRVNSPAPRGANGKARC